MHWPRNFLLEQSASLVDQLKKHERWNEKSKARLRNREYVNSVGGNEGDCASISADTEVDRISTECSRQIILKIRAAMELVSADLKKTMSNHGYGLCQVCESVISSERLMAIPWADMCLRCQDQNEKANQLNKRFSHQAKRIVNSRSFAFGART